MPRIRNLPGWLEHEPVFLRSFGNQEIACLQAFWKVILWVCCSSNAGCSEVRCTFRLLPRALQSWGACLANPVNRQQLLPFRLLLHKKTHLVFSAITGRSKHASATQTSRQFMLFTKVVNGIWGQMRAKKNSNLSDLNSPHLFPILYLILENKVQQ